MTYGNDSSSSAGYGGMPVNLGDNASSVDIVESARGRQDGFDYGADRAIGSPPNWESQDSQQLYVGATTNNEPATAEGLAQTWTQHSSELNRAADDLYTAISELGAAWIGEGAGAAQGSLVAIANSSSQAGEAANVMSNRLTQQAAAAAEVKKMPAPKEFDPAQQTAAMLAGGPAAMTADLKVQADAANDVKAQQVQYFNAYTKQMSEVDNATPSFGPASLGLKPMSGPSGLNTGDLGSGGSAGGVAGFSGGAAAGGISLSNVGADGVAAAGSGASATTNTSGVSAAPAAPAAGAGLSAGASAGVHAPSAPSAPSAPGSFGQALGGAAIGGAAGFAGGKALGAGNRSGTSKQSDTSASAQGQGSSAAAVTPPQQQQGFVPASGTIGAGATPPMAGGGMPMGGMGGARQAEEDEEHTHASFLIEADPDDAFGANEATPPPVIGAWSDDDER